MSQESRSKIIAALATIIVALLGFLGIMTSAAQQDRKLLQDQINIMTSRIDKLVKDNIKERRLVLELKLELRQVNTKQKILQGFIDSVPLPMWTKDLDGAVFRMSMINKAYEKYFDRSKIEYEGRTDFDVYPEGIAREFQKSDWRVYNSRRHVCRPENMPEGRTVDVCKFPVLVGADEKIGVGGIVISGHK